MNLLSPYYQHMVLYALLWRYSLIRVGPSFRGSVSLLMDALSPTPISFCHLSLNKSTSSTSFYNYVTFSVAPMTYWCYTIFIYVFRVGASPCKILQLCKILMDMLLNRQQTLWLFPSVIPLFWTGFFPLILFLTCDEPLTSSNCRHFSQRD